MIDSRIGRIKILSNKQSKEKKRRRLKSNLVLVTSILVIVGSAVAINILRNKPWQEFDAQAEPYVLTTPYTQTQNTAGSFQSDIQGDAVESQDVAETSDETAQKDDWRLILVNKTHPIPEDYGEIQFTKLREGHMVDSRIYPDLQQMFDDAREAGILPRITSSYRSAEQQQKVMDDKIAEYQGQGYTAEEARELAEKWVALPGTSEHQLGMAVDISTADWSKQDANEVWAWFDANCLNYGFIRRYPEDKTHITGVINEPWHFRYVGHEAAKEIWESGMCLEEFLGEAEILLEPEEEPDEAQQTASE